MEAQLNSPLPRNLQLDFFRGLALIIIFINHMPSNPWFWYTPSRFGLSDAAEVFVFLSGYASAIAYGRCFQRVGLWLGSVRILHRCGQIYSAHLTSFLLLAMICVIGNRLIPETDDIQRLNIAYFFDNPHQAVFDLFTLKYIPNYFDILPLYLVLILWVPMMWGLARLHCMVALSTSVLIYYVALQFHWELTADPINGRAWYFNPFNWQLMFFTGFGFSANWLKRPVRHWGLIVICAAIILVSIPLGHENTYQNVAFWGELRSSLEPLLDKSHLGLLRWVHLLALAYLMNQLFKWQPQWLMIKASSLIIKMGQQSLPMFLCTMSLSYICGIALDWSGRDTTNAAIVNLSGLGLMLLLSKILAWLDSEPWKAPPGVNISIQSSSPWFFFKNPELITYNRCKQALLPLFLICMATFPMLLLQKENDTFLTTTKIIAQPLPSDEFQKVTATELPESDPATALENQQQF
jgi:hypothetical protein